MHEIALDHLGTTFAAAGMTNGSPVTSHATPRRDPSLVEQFNDVCAVVELAAAIADASDFKAAAMALVNSLGWHLGALTSR